MRCGKYIAGWLYQIHFLHQLNAPINNLLQYSGKVGQ